MYIGREDLVRLACNASVAVEFDLFSCDVVLVCSVDECNSSFDGGFDVAGV